MYCYWQYLLNLIGKLPLGSLFSYFPPTTRCYGNVNTGFEALQVPDMISCSFLPRDMVKLFHRIQMDDLHWGHYLAIYYTFYLFLEWRVGEYIKFDLPSPIK